PIVSPVDVVESYAEEEVDKSPDEGSLSSTADAGAAKADTSRSYSADAEDSDNNGTFTLELETTQLSECTEELSRVTRGRSQHILRRFYGHNRKLKNGDSRPCRSK
ncbi:hypothetical protein KUCAC02_009996, partial [Chaenocephalus aceratus]